MDKPLLRVEHLKKVYPQPDKDLTILTDISFTLKKGEIVALMGASGSGKSTLLHLVGLLDKITSGHIFYEGKDHTVLSAREADLFRSQRLGFIYQQHYLLPDFTAQENVMIPLLIQKVSAAEAAQQATKILQQVGLGHRLSHKPWELSGGEQQRVTIARSLVHRPFLLLADEPTGNLDEENAASFFALLLDLVKTAHLTTLFATHDARLAKQADRILYLHEGTFKTPSAKVAQGL